MEKCEHFVKSSGRNRCEIGSAQGRQTLSIPIAGGRGQQLAITAVQIANDKNWQRQHWHALQTAYGKAPYFEDYAPYFEPFFAKTYTQLWDFNLELLQMCLKLLHLPIQPEFTSAYEKSVIENLFDFRNQKMIRLNSQKPYYQGFTEQTGFLTDLSILDLLFQLGPESKAYLQSCVHQEKSA